MAAGRVVREWPSSKPGRKPYQLIEGKDGVVYCTCMAWRFSKERPRTCKHMVEWADSIARGGAFLVDEGSR